MEKIELHVQNSTIFIFSNNTIISNNPQITEGNIDSIINSLYTSSPPFSITNTFGEILNFAINLKPNPYVRVITPLHLLNTISKTYTLLHKDKKV